MEITIDVGKNILSDMKKIATDENVDLEIIALKILDLGLRVYQSKNDDSVVEVDPVILETFEKVLENNLLLKEIIFHVFSKERSPFKTYDSSSAISVVENMAKAYIQGKNKI